MQKLLFPLALFFFFETAKAQNIPETIHPLTTDQKSPDFLQYRDRWNLKIGAGIGSTYRTSESLLSTAVFSFSAEPSFRLTNFIALGLKGEYTIMKSYVSGAGRVKSDPIASLAITGDVIKLWNHRYAPFLGMGAGFYYLGYGQFPANKPLNNESQSVDRRSLGTRFGLSPRIGVNINQYSIAIEMHLIDEKTFYNRDYGTLKVGYTL